MKSHLKEWDWVLGVLQGEPKVCPGPADAAVGRQMSVLMGEHCVYVF